VVAREPPVRGARDRPDRRGQGARHRPRPPADLARPQADAERSRGSRCSRSYSEGDVVEGRVTKVVTFGAFVEILPGVEGLVHISELAQHHVENPREVVSQGPGRSTSRSSRSTASAAGSRSRSSASRTTSRCSPAPTAGESVHLTPQLDSARRSPPTRRARAPTAPPEAEAAVEEADGRARRRGACAEPAPADRGRARRGVSRPVAVAITGGIGAGKERGRWPPSAGRERRRCRRTRSSHDLIANDEDVGRRSGAPRDDGSQRDRRGGLRRCEGLVWLEELLHPLVRRRTDAWLEQVEVPVAAVEIPLLYERAAESAVRQGRRGHGAAEPSRGPARGGGGSREARLIPDARRPPGRTTSTRTPARSRSSRSSSPPCSPM
jgi:hypothetical protein